MESRMASAGGRGAGVATVEHGGLTVLPVQRLFRIAHRPFLSRPRPVCSIEQPASRGGASVMAGSVKPIISAGFARNIVIPGWIVTVGFAAVTGPVLGVLTSLAVFTVGV